MSKPKLVIMCGLPRSGKSTVARSLADKHGYAILGRDYVREALCGTRKDHTQEGTVTFVIQTAVKALALSGVKGVVIDETSIRRKYRKVWQKDFGHMYDVVFYEVDTASSVCMKRAVETEQGDLVPVIERMAGQFDPLSDDEPRYREED